MSYTAAVIISLHYFFSWKAIFSSYVTVYVSLFSFFLRKESISFSYHTHTNDRIINAEWQRRDLISWSSPGWETKGVHSLTSCIRGTVKCEFTLHFGRTWHCFFFSFWGIFSLIFCEHHILSLPHMQWFSACSAFVGKVSHTNDGNLSSLRCNLQRSLSEWMNRGREVSHHHVTRERVKDSTDY